MSPEIASPPIEAVAFDVDGVIRHFAPADVAAIEQRHGLNEGALAAAAFAPELADLALTGRIDRAEWIRRVGQAVGSAPAADEWLTGPGRGTVDPEVLELIDLVRTGGRPVALFTNATDTLPAELTAADLDHRVDVVVNSFDVGSAKPDRRFFAAACEQLGVRPDATYFTDDSQTNVIAARQYGLRAMPFVTASQCRRELIDLGVLDR